MNLGAIALQAVVTRHMAVVVVVGRAKVHVSHYFFASQVAAVSRRGLRGWRVNYPIFAYDIAALRWD